jgi:hypothetical protein|tara:strand:- start:2879 stop:3424 length:546 start_codon:yes stop_codon:yes gene_type:complete
MTKQTKPQVLKLSLVPHIQTGESVDQYIEKLKEFCVAFHTEVKDIQFNSEKEKASYFMWLMINSNEPQYQALRLIFQFQKEKAGDSVILDSIFAQVELLDVYRKKVDAQSFEDRAVRTMAEVYYWGDMTVKEIVVQLVSIKLLPERDNDNNSAFDTHLQRITQYVSSFPNFNPDIRRSQIK